ncbi:uncharacterized protein LOC141556791 isoform X2 [Sminthopsis crassicaudata]|uniref:uncharacterized protein LOC141556791 isoform X2 n=1 Tax=Sminthopsis crassicaudata TaxID=9301 RepID=UPI003D69F105
MAGSEQVGSATVTVVVKATSLSEAGHDTGSLRFLLHGSKMLLLDLGEPETLEHRFTFDRVLGPEHAQEAEQEFMKNIRAVLGSVSRGYSVSVIIRGREAKQLDLVPQLLAMLFEETQLHSASEPSLRTLSLVQLTSSGTGRDLLLPGTSDLNFLDVSPLGLVAEGASEAEILDFKSGCQLYLRAMKGLDRACSLLTLTISCLGPSIIKRPWARSMCRGSLRVLQLPEALDCPLLLVLAGKASKAHTGSLPWIVTQLLFGNSYNSLLLHLDLRAIPLGLLLASLAGAEGVRDPRQGKQISPTLWDALEEIHTRYATVQELRSGLSGTTLQESQLTQLSLVLRELKVLKNQSRSWGTRVLNRAGASVTRLPNLQVLELEEAFSPVFKKHLQGTSETLDLGRKSPLPAASRNYPLGGSKKQAPDVALQFMLAQAHRQLLQEHHQSQIQEELSWLGQDKETATHQAPDLTAESRMVQDHTALVLKLEALRVERDAAEQDLEALYELHVQGARAQTCHMLQVFRACRELWKEQTAARELHHRILLSEVLQDAISLATQNQQLQVQNKQLQQEVTERRKKV